MYIIHMYRSECFYLGNNNNNNNIDIVLMDFQKKSIYYYYIVIHETLQLYNYFRYDNIAFNILNPL